jgi:hypothetical protein
VACKKGETYNAVFGASRDFPFSVLLHTHDVTLEASRKFEFSMSCSIRMMSCWMRVENLSFLCHVTWCKAVLEASVKLSFSMSCPIRT